MAKPTNNRRRSFQWPFALLLGVGLGLSIGRARSPSPVVASKAPETPVPAVSRFGSEGEQDLVGIVLAERTADLATQIAGRIESIPFKLGDEVSAGATLAVLDDRLLRRSLAAAEASWRAAAAARDRTRFEWEDAAMRLGRLGRAGEYLSVDERDAARLAEMTARARLAEAEAVVEQRRAAAEELREQLVYTVMRAPFGGVVSYRYADPGAALPAHSRVVRIVSRAEAYLRFAVPTDAVPTIKPGLPIEVGIEALGSRLTGVVARVAPEIDSASGMVFAEADLDIPSNLRSSVAAGSLARVRLARGSGEPRTAR